MSIKEKLIKLKKQCVTLSMILGISLTGCGQESEQNNTEFYQIVFVDGNPYLTTASVNFFQSLKKDLVIPLYDVNTHDVVARFSRNMELDKDVVFSNELGSSVSLFSVIFCDDIINSDIITDETYQFLSTDSDGVKEYIKNNYLYDVNFCEEYEDKKYYTPLGIYEFGSSQNNDIQYHIGYNANRIYESDYIYDIVENRIYQKPEEGNCNFIPISDLCNKKQITATDADILLTKYLNEKGQNKHYVKNKKLF